MAGTPGPQFFGTQDAFRDWLLINHAGATELWLGFWKKSSGRGGLEYPQAVDEALCFGWIDGIRKTLDSDSFTNRFTPRRKGSVWSLVNVRRIGELRGAGRVHPAGEAAFAARTDERTGIYSAEQSAVELGIEDQARFEGNSAAWGYWQRSPAGYRKSATWWVISAKKEETRLRRLTTLIAESANGKRLDQLSRPKQSRNE